MAAGNAAAAAAGRLFGANTAVRAMGAMDEAAWSARYLAWRVNPRKGDFGTIPRDLNVGGLCREVAGMTPGGMLSSMRTEAAAAAGEAGALEAAAGGTMAALDSAAQALAGIHLNASGNAASKKRGFSLKAIREGATAMAASAKTATKEAAKKASKALETAAERVNDGVEAIGGRVDTLVAEVSGTAADLQALAEGAYDAYIDIAKEERKVNLRIRGFPDGPTKTALERQAEGLKREVKRLRKEAKAASTAALKVGRIAGYHSYRHGGGGRTRRAGAKKLRSSRRSSRSRSRK